MVTGNRIKLLSKLSFLLAAILLGGLVFSGCVGGDGRGRRQVAPFETACLIAAELGIRLAQCHTKRHDDQKLVIFYFCYDLPYLDIARREHISFDEVFSRVESALSYISSGRIPRWHPDHTGRNRICNACTYEQWKGHWRLRGKI